MKIIGVIQARINSSRLPGKVLLEIQGKPILWHIYNRLQKCKLLDSVVISTGESNKNKQIIDFANQNKIPIFVGSEDDLINRLYKTAKNFEASAIVRITADCPLVDPDLLDQLLREFIDNENTFDIITNNIVRTYPHGLDLEVYSTKILEKLDKEMIPELREWFALYILKNTSKFRLLNKKHSVDLSNHRWTIDYPEDYEFIKKIYDELYSKDQIFVMNDILKLLQKKSQLLKINSKYIGIHNIDSPADKFYEV